jgi:hypothetical protein
VPSAMFSPRGLPHLRQGCWSGAISGMPPRV